MPIVSFRPARVDDAALLFAWQQHPETRKFARNPEPPEWDGHLAWLGKTLADNDRELLIAESERHPVGMLRLDTTDKHREVSIFVAPGLKHRGIGRAMLEWMKRERPFHCYAAFIADHANLASGRLFAKAGFQAQFNGWWYLHMNFDSAEIGDPMNPHDGQTRPPYIGAKCCHACKRWLPSDDPVDPRSYEDFYCRCNDRDAA